MKTCLQCGTKYDDDLFNCPGCGDTSSIASYGGDDALAALESMSRANDAERLVDRAAELYLAGDHSGAVAKLHEALEVNPKSAMANFNMGYILLEQGKAGEAVRWLETALSINPTIEGGPATLARAKQEQGQQGGCFIATVAYGADSVSVLELRRFRDERLLRGRLGRAFVRTYYARSPAVARWLSDRPRTARLLRVAVLDPLVALVRRID